MNYVGAWEYVKKLSSHRTQHVLLKHIIKLQRMLLPSRSGLRKKPHQIVRVRDAKVLLALPQEVPALMERLIQWLHTEVSTTTVMRFAYSEPDKKRNFTHCGHHHKFSLQICSHPPF